MDMFESRMVKPMLIGAESEPFDSPDYIYELKLDGERCLAYIDSAGVELRNKRNIRMLPKVPELTDIYKQVKKRCILDGELIVLKEGKPDFAEIQRRSLMSNKVKIEFAASKYPASFTAFDVLYLDNKEIINEPLMKRKAMLSKIVKENDRIAVSPYIEMNGTAFYNLAEKNNLEGIVAKKKESKYYLDKRTKEWIKIKNLKDDDFVVCGYIDKGKGVISIVLGQYRGTTLVYKGHVTLGVSGKAFDTISRHRTIDNPEMEVPAGHGNEKAVWLQPDLVCVVKYLELTTNGSLRHAVLKGLRDDKLPTDCIDKS